MIQTHALREQLGPVNLADLDALTRAQILIKEAHPDLPMKLKFELTDPEVLAQLLSVEDLTLPTPEGSRRNIIGIVFDNVLAQLNQAGFSNITVIRDTPVVPAAENFDALLFPGGNPGRSATYTRYVDKNNILRTHTSALIPRTLAQLSQVGVPDDITLVLPGLVYRRDVIDPRHLDVFHQIDVWTVQKNEGRQPTSREDLLKLARTIFEAACPGAEMKVLEANHPYTVDGIEVYAVIGDQEIEVFEAGLAHPDVLRNAGIDPEQYSGLALGMGIERLIMARKQLPDIRLIRSTNPKVIEQMSDMKPYKEVSNQPANKRDLSYCQPLGLTEEDISENIRVAFGENAPLIEEIVIVSRTSHEDLHEKAAERLGSHPDLENVLVRVVLRHPDRSITKAEAGAMYKDAYPKLHRGTEVGYNF